MKIVKCKMKSNRLKIILRNITLIIIVSFVIFGCKPPEEVKKSEKVEPVPKAPLPATTMNIATINLSKFGTKFEKSSISKFVDLVKAEDLQLLSIQGVTRYPEIQTRVDIIEELQKQTDMYYKFGETQNNSGRQSGNAIFSTYPVKLFENLEFKKLKSLATALTTSIDVGIGNLIVASTLIPENLSTLEKLSCVSDLGGIQKKSDARYFLITGNIGTLDSKSLNGFNLASSDMTLSSTNQILFLMNGGIKLIETRKIETHFGLLTIYELHLFNLPSKENR